MRGSCWGQHWYDYLCLRVLSGIEGPFSGVEGSARWLSRPACGFHNEAEGIQCASAAQTSRARFQICPVCGMRNGLRDLYCISCLALLPAASEVTFMPPMAEPSESTVLKPLANLTHALPQADIDVDPEIPHSQVAANVPPRRLSAATVNHAATAGRQPPLPKTFRAVLYGLIILAALIPLLPNASVNTSSSVNNAVPTFRHAVEHLPPEAVVLVSFDYGPAYAGELDPLADMVLDVLHERSARILLMSTHPLGAALAERAAARLTQAGQYGKRLSLLGYLPGEEAGLRLNLWFAGCSVDIEQRKPMRTFPIIQPASLQRIIVISSDSENIRRWLEQVTSRQGIPIDVLCSALAKPQLIPYYLSGQITSLTGGLPGLMEQSDQSRDNQSVQGYRLGLSAVLLLVALTGLAANLKSSEQ